MHTRQIEFQEQPNGCWNCTSHAPDKKGYIQVRRREKLGIHRFLWQECFGEIPPGMFVCHRCDNPLCLNPEHLFLGTEEDNRIDMYAKKRNARGEGVGNAKLTDEAVRDIRTSSLSQNALARKYHVTQAAIWYALHGRNWGWLKTKAAQ